MLKDFQGSISGNSARHQERKLYLPCRGEEVFNIEILLPVSSPVVQTDYPITEKKYADNSSDDKQKEMMSMTHRSAVRKRPVEMAVPRNDIVQTDTSALAGGGFTTLLQSVAQEILAVTYWFDPAPHAGPYPVTVRFSGHRLDVKGRMQAGDRFVQDETIEEVIPGSGPISLTARVRGINPGSWVVTAHQLQSAHPARGQRKQGNAAPEVGPQHPIVRFWRRWAPPVESTEPVKTCLTPFAHVPGTLPGIWAALVTLGVVVALVFQSLVISGDHLAIGPWWAVSLVAIVVGIIGAKGWFVILHWREHRIEGWCIQGFIARAPLAAAIMLVVLKMPVGVFLDVTAPGLLVAMAVGRVGCFFAGCCGGPPTASRWGVWSSDQRVGARRIPTQLLESLLALSLGLLVLVAVLSHGPANGALFVAVLAAYTLGRQGILHLRAEPRKTRLVTAILATLVLIADLLLLAK
jgi:phosphatidylglycerol---prolipoprotein diacylglyceryl transferase